MKIHGNSNASQNLYKASTDSINSKFARNVKFMESFEKNYYLEKYVCKKGKMFQVCENLKHNNNAMIRLDHNQFRILDKNIK